MAKSPWLDRVISLIRARATAPRKSLAAGVSVESEVWEDMPHVWQHFASILPEAQHAIARIGEFVRKYV